MLEVVDDSFAVYGSTVNQSTPPTSASSWTYLGKVQAFIGSSTASYKIGMGMRGGTNSIASCNFLYWEDPETKSIGSILQTQIGGGGFEE